ncbi:hypothetical protein FB451DRAFT_1213723 [Mycena latifolia]|nr:hypothetical protein FB451DRAFT_1213723 [Mycena latifolia]
MRFSTSFLTLAFVSLCAAVPFGNSTESSLAKRSVHCETNGGSPITGDATAAAKHIQNLVTQECCQGNAGGSLCTTMWCVGTACVGICSNGAFDSFNSCDTCLDASNGLLDIANSCSSGGLSGGWADAPNNLHLILFHS